jgi:hypothetical protein
MNRLIRYTVANLLYAAGVIALVIAHPQADIHPLYLISLFVLCSSPLLDMTRWNDRYVLLAAFSAFYFVMYGLLDTVHLILATLAPSKQAAGAGGQSLISEPEALILVGGILAQLGYRIACRTARHKTLPTLTRDWSESSLVIVGCLLWAISTWLTWKFEVNVLVGWNPEGRTGVEKLTQLQALIYMIATYLQPLGIVFLAYAQCRYRRRYMLLLVVAAIGVEMVLGFVADMKGEFLLGLILVLLTKFLMDGKIPKMRAAILLVVIAAVFPILQANRMVRGQYGTTNIQAVQSIIEGFKRAVSANTTANSGPDRAQSFIERSSLKGNVDLIVSRTGNEVRFQNGHTLAPILTTFIPRILWPDKPTVETGRVMNLAFLITPDEPGTYISPSHLGEFYWNFGWPGALVGMSLIGLLFGLLGAGFDLSQSVTLTRLLVVIVTIKLLVLGAESSVATQYAMWLRSMLAIWLLHLVFGRSAARNSADRSSLIANELSSLRAPGALAPLPFSNLMR